MEQVKENNMEVALPEGVKVLIVRAPYYTEIADNLLKGATTFLEQHKIKYDVMDVPGALEIPAGIKYAIKGKEQYDAFITLGCIIRGESYHFEIVCHESARKLYDLVDEHNLALGNGVLTVENKKQAEDRSQPTGRNNGQEAAIAAVHMLMLKLKMSVQ